MADTALSALTATTTLASGDLMYVVDGGNSRKIDWDNVVAQLSAATKTLTNTTIDANGTGNSISNIETADIATAAKTGADTALVTGTAGTSGNLASWNADGDLVDAGSATSAFATAAQGDLADTAVQPGDDAADLGSGAATDGWVLTADGAGGAAWEVSAGGSSVTDYVRTRAGTTQDLFDMADTWNDAGTTFTAIKMNVTDTASNASSLLMDLQVGGVSELQVGKDGQVLSGRTASNSPTYSFVGDPDTGWGYRQANTLAAICAASECLRIQAGKVDALTSTIGASISGALALGAAGTFDIYLERDAANTLAQRNGANAQTFNLYSSYTDASNYTRGAFKASSGLINVEAESAGTGDSNIDIQLTPKGTGAVRFGTHAAIGAETVTGYIEIKDAGGTVRKVAVVS